jgi:hypothetical protein
VAPGLRVEAVAAVMSWTLFGAGIDWSRSTDPHPLDRAVDDIVSVLLRGVSEMFPQRRPIAVSDDTAEPGSRTGRHDHAAHVALRR